MWPGKRKCNLTSRIDDHGAIELGVLKDRNAKGVT